MTKKAIREIRDNESDVTKKKTEGDERGTEPPPGSAGRVCVCARACVCVCGGP